MTEARSVSELLVAHYAPISAASQAERYLPIPRPDFHDLPPTMQAAVSKRMHEQREQQHRERIT